MTFVPGGGADIIGRYLAQALDAALGQTVIVENKPGAGGMLGTEAGGPRGPMATRSRSSRRATRSIRASTS